jgi:hypothetical protein
MVADDPRQSVPDELEGRLDSLSATLTDDEIGTTGRAGARGEVGDADPVDADADDTDADADDTDAS